MNIDNLPALSRYFGSLAAGVGIVALSAMFLIEAPGTSHATAPMDSPTVATLKRAVGPKSLPQLKASDLDISRVVAVNVVGKAEPRSLPATAASDAATKSEARLSGSGTSALVIADAANLRAAADKDSDRLDVVRHGAAVTVLATERGWSRVITEDGTTGWLASKFLSQ